LAPEDRPGSRYRCAAVRVTFKGVQLLRANPLLGDSVSALVLAAAGEAEVWTTGGGSAALRAAVAAAMTLPLAARRSFPLLTVLAVMGAALAQSLIAADADFAGVLVIAIIVAAYSVAAHETRAVGAVGGGAGLASMLVSAHREGGGVGNYVFASAIFVGAWLAGLTVRERRLRAETLEERTVELEQDQEARARAAVAEERARIARDLHHVVVHSMSEVVVQAGAERLALPDDLASTREVLASTEQTGRQGLVEMRRLVEMLRRDDEELALGPQPSVAHLDCSSNRCARPGSPLSC
jgi:signal transduction histidine kinase